jgi:hypothetical protein
MDCYADVKQQIITIVKETKVKSEIQDFTGMRALCQQLPEIIALQF